jgi:hypothetical protein
MDIGETDILAPQAGSGEFGDIMAERDGGGFFRDPLPVTE